MIIPIPFVHIAMGALFVALSIPLVLRIIPSNRLYGVRTRKAFASNSNWYEVNAYGGKWLLALGLLLIAAGWFGKPYAPSPRSPLAPLWFLAPLIFVVPVLVAIHRFDKRLPEKE